MRTGKLLLGILLPLAVCLAVRAGEPERRKMAFTLSVEAEYPHLENQGIDAQVQDWLSDYIHHIVSEVDATPDPDVPDGGFTLDMEYEISRPSDAAVSIVWTVFTYARSAAHPLTGVETLNYATADGDRLGLEDLFAKPEAALRIFSEQAPKLIGEEYKKSHPDQFADGIEGNAWFKEGFEPTPDNYNALSLEPEGVRIHFAQYQILPYAFGMPSPLIPLELLEEAEPNPEIWGKDGGK